MKSNSNALLKIAGGSFCFRKIRVGVSGFYQEFYQNNYIFNNPDAPIGFELLKPFNQLYQYGQANGIEFVTLDLVDDFSTLDIVLFFDLPNMALPVIKKAMDEVAIRYLCIYECELIKHDNWLPQVHQMFSRVFTWHDGVVDHNRFLKINFVTDLLPWISQALDDKEKPVSESLYHRKLICNISGNKMVSHPNELYSKRLEFISWYERYQPADFDLFGVGWDKAHHPSYQGKVDDKLAVLANYRFAICFENAKNIPGYITEKIIDCFKAGVVPVYMGAPNVSEWIPEGCYILADDFSSPAELHEFISNMPIDIYNGYLERIRDFWISGKSYPFSSDAFINTLTTTVVKDVLTITEQPDVSVVIPNYNHGEFLPAAIASALKSTIKVEVIVLDNASTDDSWDRVQIYADQPDVRLVRNRWNIGVQHNWNHMMQVATGRYVVLLSADDLLMPTHLDKAVRLLDSNPDTALYYTPCLWINERDEPLGVMNHPGHLSSDYIGGRNEVVGMLSYDSYITPSAAVMRRSVLSQVGSLDIHLKGAFDWDLWIRLAEISPDFIFSKEPGVAYRQHSTNGSIAFYSSTAPLEDHIRILKGVLSRSLISIGKSDAASLASLLKNRFFSYSATQTDWLRESFDDVIEQLKNENLDLVSVIIPTKNRPGLLANALESLCYQTFKDFEVVIHNDGGCDVGDLIAFYQDRLRIVYIRSATSGGAAAARNKALKLASGSIITYLDDDDVYLDTHIESVVNALNNSEELFVYTGAEYVIQERRKGSLVELHRENVFDKFVYTRDRLLVNNFIPTPTWAHRSSLLKFIGGFNENLTILEDWDFLLNASKFTNFKCIKEITVEIRNDKSRSDHTLRSCEDRFINFHEEIYKLHPSDSSEVLKGRKRFIADLNRRQSGIAPVSYDYEQWLEKLSTTELSAQIHAERMMLQWGSRYQFNLLMLVGESDFELLSKTIDSLCEQLYKHWRLIVVSDQPVPDTSFEDNETLGWLTIESLDVESVTDALNGILEAIPADWISLIKPGTKLESTALLKVGDRLLLNPSACVIYTDHDEYTPEDVRINPSLKPDFNLDLLRSEDYIGDAVFFRTEQLLLAGGFYPYPEAQSFDATLRLIEMFGVGVVSHVPFPILSMPENNSKKQIKYASTQVAIESHLARLGIRAEVATGYVDGTFQVYYQHQSNPLISIIIPNKNKLEFLAPCVDSLFEKTSYKNFELIIVDNQSSDPDLLAFYDVLQGRYPDRVRVVQYDAPFNFSDQCNLGAKFASGEFLLLLNNDMEIIQPQWLDRMLEHALRPEVGVVGAKLLYPETARLQHAGVVLGAGYPDGLAYHFHVDLPMEQDTMLNRSKVVQNFSAVTAACLMVKKDLYTDVGGMDAEQFGILFNDVDLCLRVNQIGKSIVWTPFASLIHHAHKSLLSKHDTEASLYLSKQTKQQRENFLRKWLPVIANDPCYHPFLSRTNVGDGLDNAFAVGWDDIPDSRPKIMALPLSGGSGEYRIKMPLRTLESLALAQSQSFVSNSHPRLPMVSELARNRPDVFIIQNALAPQYEEMLPIFGEFLPSIFRVQMLDDLLSDIPKDSSMHKHFQKYWKDAKTRLRNTLKHCDRLIVSTQPLKDFAADMIEDIVVMPNMLERSVWGGLQSKRRVSTKPRVGWVGAQQHGGDLALIFEVVKATSQEVDWVFQGMCPEEIRPYVKEWSTDWLPINLYPEAIAKLNLDLAIAPLEVNAFNEAKSNLRLLEYGALGWPVICTDIYPYRENSAPVCLVPNQADAWIAAIREHITNLDLAAKKGDQLKAWVHKHYMIEDHASEWLAALTR